MGHRAAGWYPTPSGRQERYWDGAAWTDQTRQVARPRAVVVEDDLDAFPQPSGGSPQPTGAAPPRRPRRPWRFPRLANLVALLPVLLLLPISVVCAVPLVALVAAVLDAPLWTMMIGWFATSLLVLLPWLRPPIAWWYFRARPAGPRERDLLDQPWRAAAASADVRPERFRLRVCDSPQVCGPPVGGRTIMVTTRALHGVSPDQLSALLAHELGHHLGMHAGAPVLMVWLTLPVMAVGWLSSRFAALTGLLWQGMTMLRGGRRPMRWSLLGLVFGVLRASVCWALFCLMGLLWLGAHLVRGATTAAIWVARVLATPVAHAGEYAADRIAVRLGFGSALYDVLNTQVPAGEAARVGLPGPARLWGNPPPLVSRLRRLEAAHTAAGQSGP